MLTNMIFRFNFGLYRFAVTMFLLSCIGILFSGMLDGFFKISYLGSLVVKLNIRL